MNDKELVMATLDAYADAYCAKDLDVIMNVFLDSDDISAIGTGADELCSGRNEVRDLFARNFEQSTAIKFEWGWHHVHIKANDAVVAMNLIIHLKQKEKLVLVPIRWTVAMRKEQGAWKWIHRNASMAYSSQKAGEAYPEQSEK